MIRERLAPNSLDVASSLNNLGNVARNRGDLEAARGYHSRALVIRERLAPNSLTVADSLNNLGNVAQDRGDLEAAQDYYSRALAIKERLAPNSLTIAGTLNNLGSIARARGSLAVAQDYHSRALAIREQLAPNSLAVAASLNNLGNIARARGDLERAQHYYNRALAIHERLAPNSLTVADSLTNLGVVAFDRGDLVAAQDYHIRALTIQERLAPNSLAVADSLNNLGVVARARGDLTMAQDYHIRALAIQERLASNSLTVAASLHSLGVVAHDRGDLTAAQDYHRRALVIRERLAPNSLTVAASLNSLGVVAFDCGDLTAAQDYYSRALAIKERLAPNSLTVAGGLNNLGNVARARGDLAAAQNYHSRALVIRERLAPDSLDVADSLNNLGSIARARGDVTAAQDYHNRALAIRERLAPGSLGVAGSLSNLGSVALKQCRFSDALPLLTRAVEIVEAQRRQIPSTEARAFLIAQHTEPYTELLRAHLALNDLPAAFATLERARARSLLELLTEARADIRQGVDPTLLKRERALQELLNAKEDRRIQALNRGDEKQAAMFTKEIEELLTQYKEVQAQIRAKSPKYAALTQPQPLSLKEIQEHVLDEDTLLLEYALGEERSFLWAVTPTSISSFELPKRADVEAAAKRVYDVLKAEADADFPDALIALSRMLLEPVADQLGKKRLLIVADGALQYVPFGALPAPKRPLSVVSGPLLEKTNNNGQRTTDDGQPLIVDHEIVSLPSASVLAVLRREMSGRKPAEKVVAVVADPVFQSDDPRVKIRDRRPKTQDPRLKTSDFRLQTSDLKKEPAATHANPPSAIRHPQSEGSPSPVERSARESGLSSFIRLPLSRQEAEQIARLATPATRFTALDFDASKPKVTGARLDQYRIVHFATHGLLNSQHPELSGIVLSLVDEQGQPQDGFLRLHEVYNLELNADLVVLSACQTALGKKIRGEGLIGLTRGFMYAGAPRVVASLWKVDDKATAELMKRFYQKMLRENMRPATALRAAQLSMLKEKRWSAPYYWAGFVLLGEWQ